jgi:hypothetical protein
VKIWASKSLVDAAHETTPKPIEPVALKIEFNQFTIR